MIPRIRVGVIEQKRPQQRLRQKEMAFVMPAHPSAMHSFRAEYDYRDLALAHDDGPRGEKIVEGLEGLRGHFILVDSWLGHDASMQDHRQTTDMLMLAR